MIVQGSNLPLYFSNIPVSLDSIADISAGLYTREGRELKHWGKDDLTIVENGILAPITQAESMGFPIGRCTIEIKMSTNDGLIIPGLRVGGYISRRDDKTALSGEQPQTLRYVDIDCSNVLTDVGAVVGASAYELAVKYGFTGTVEEWLDSLRYDHSEEFAAFVKQISDNARTAQEAAQTSVNAASAAETAKNDAEKAEGNASTSESNAKASEGKALKASADAVAAKEEIQASADQIAKNATDIDELKGELSQLSEDKIDNPSTGSVGQILEIESVDENGKPKTYKATNKPTSGEVSDEQISSAVSEYMANNPIEESDPTVPDWAKSPQKPTYTASEVGAETSGTAESKVSAHNVSDTAHNDIRLLVQGLAERLNTLADSDDETLDQMSEVVAYIKSNKNLIDAITTSKINVSDIIDNLTTNASNKPLSAAQGVALKALIDAIPKTSAGMERIEKLSTDTAVELEPNKLYIFPEMSELAITLAEHSDTGIANEYHVVFQSGSTPTAFMIPSAINLPSEFAVEANNVYRISILEGCLTAYSWHTIPFVFHVKIDSSLDYPYLYCWETYKNVGNTIWGDVWPGEPMVENENGWFTRELPPQQHNGNLHCIVTNEAGNNQTLDIDVDVSKSDVWITVNASYEYMVYYEEPTI